jgi:hypothetical protein
MYRWPKWMAFATLVCTLRGEAVGHTVNLGWWDGAHQPALETQPPATSLRELVSRLTVEKVATNMASACTWIANTAQVRALCPCSSSSPMQPLARCCVSPFVIQHQLIAAVHVLNAHQLATHDRAHAHESTGKHVGPSNANDVDVQLH